MSHRYFFFIRRAIDFIPIGVCFVVAFVGEQVRHGERDLLAHARGLEMQFQQIVAFAQALDVGLLLRCGLGGPTERFGLQPFGGVLEPFAAQFVEARVAQVELLASLRDGQNA